MKRLSKSDLSVILARCEVFIGPETEPMKFEQYSDLYDQFVGNDLPRLVEHLNALESENERLRSSRLRTERRGR